MTKPTVPEVLPIVQKLFKRNPVGCCWHVVLHDRNPQCVDSTAAEILAGRYACGFEECTHLAHVLPLMSRTQILKLASLC